MSKGDKNHSRFLCYIHLKATMPAILLVATPAFTTTPLVVIPDPAEITIEPALPQREEPEAIRIWPELKAEVPARKVRAPLELSTPEFCVPTKITPLDPSGL